MPRQRGNGEGSYRKRENGSWEGRILINGRSHSRYGKTKAEAQRQINELIRLSQKGLLFTSTNTATLSEWVSQWIADTVSLQRKSSTVRNYTVIAKHIPQEIGSIKLQNLRPTDIQRLIKILTTKQIKVKPDAPVKFLSPRTIGLVRQVIRAAMNDAIAKNLITYNPAASVTMPRLERKEMKTLSRDDINKLIASEMDEPLLPCIIFIIFTGLRRGEALGLRWADIDLAAGAIHIVQSLTRAAKGFALSDPKTLTSKRMIPLPQTALDILAQQRAKSSAADNPQNLVFAYPDGTPYSPDSLRKILTRILTKLDIPTIRVHDLRHTFASQMLMAEVNPKVVQELMGHSTITTTLGTYSHTTPSLKMSAATTLETYLKPSPKTDTETPEKTDE